MKAIKSLQKLLWFRHPSRFEIGCGTGIAILSAALRAHAFPVEFLSARPDLIIHQTQSWGELGIDTAAHERSKAGAPLRIGSQSYTNGIGHHANGEIVVWLGGQYERFEAEAGVQPCSGGSVIFRVSADGRPLFDSGIVRDGDEARALNVTVAGAQELTLEALDAGDGVSCDMANWAIARLMRDPGVKPVDAGVEVDMAPFATVRTSDPARMEGTTATRLQPIPAAELFMDAPVRAEANGAYIVPTVVDGRGCLGIEWLERRRLQRLELQFAEPFPPSANIEVQYWQMGYKGRTEGGSRWQGQWQPLPGQITRESKRWVMRPDWTGKAEARTGTLKVRWIFPAAAERPSIAAIHAFTSSRFSQAELSLQVENGDPGASGTVEVYNGSFADTGGIRKSWRLDQPLRLSVRYALSRPWQLSDRTTLRLTLPNGAFAVAVDDVVKAGPVYVPHAAFFISTDSQPQTAADYRKITAGKKGVLERVRSLPDQTSKQAMEHVYIPESSYGPTMLSLACDNRKFVLDRTGKISWDNDPAVQNSIAGLLREYSGRLVVGFGSNKPEDIQRHYEHDWLPIVIIEKATEGISLRQRTFVAPLDEPKGRRATWLRDRALGVSEFTVANTGGKRRTAGFTLDISDSYPTNVATTLRVEGRRAIAEKGGRLLALVETTHEALTISSDAGHVLRVAGELPAGIAARCVVYLPNWKNPNLEDLPPSTATDDLASRTRDYWKTVMADGMRVKVPDPLLNNVIPASVMHCLMAARNDQERTVAPWIAPLLYGPWDSEAQSVIRGLQSTGNFDFARRGLDYFIERYNQEGFLTTGYTVMGTGWHLWALGEYYALTKDKSWLKEKAPDVARVCRWVMAQREKTKQLDAQGGKVPEYGLMPPGVMADWDAFNYYFYLNSYYYAGLKAAGEALADIGWADAQKITANAAEYRQEILRAYRWVQARAPVVKLRSGHWVPFYPTHVYSPMPIGDLYAGEDQGRSWCYDIELGAHHLIPLGVLDPMSPQADWLVNHMEDVQFLRSGWFHYGDEAANQADWFNLGGFSKVQPYYTRMGDIYALRDDPKPFLRTYFNSLMSLLNREDLSIWEHFVGGSFNKPHETGNFLHQTRLMLAQERGDELWLAPLIPGNWLRDGQRVEVRNAPTAFGPVSYWIRSNEGAREVQAEVSSPQRSQPERIVLRLRHPDGLAIHSVQVDGREHQDFDRLQSTIRLAPQSAPLAVRVRFAD